MTALPLTRKRFTSEEYLLIERGADTRSEFLDGEIYAMSGGSRAHITINDNLTAAIHGQLKRTACQGMSQNMKVPAGAARLYSYPDYLIVCGEQRFHDTQRDVLINPGVIFEILSPSTAQYDRITKFDLYKQIDSLREYILIEQDRPRVEHYVRMDGDAWKQIVLSGLDAVLTLESAPATVALVDLYDRIDFAPETGSPGG
jgi:Uma2 family endonuclease